ncbi:MAG: TetR family transcriptional regulator C-terminal domain-containing protein, partial [Gammaproteobacteria bacterium]
GCLMICTAPAESINSPEIKDDLANLIKRVDKAFEENIANAISAGQLEKDVEMQTLAMHIQASLHTIALRARAGSSKQLLRKYADFAVRQLPWSQPG